MGEVLKLDPQIAAHRARDVAGSQNFLFLARGLQYPMAMEGALKLKEVSYIHAEGYPAGEMKHGPIALIDRNMPVVAIALDDGTRDKMLSNIEQVRARDGIVIGIVTEGDARDRGEVRARARAAADDAARSTRCSAPSRCSCCRTTSPSAAAATSTSRGTWRRPSPWSSQGSSRSS